MNLSKEIEEETVPKLAFDLYCRRPLFPLQKMAHFRMLGILCNKRKLLELILKCKKPEDFDSNLYIKRGREWREVEATAKEMVSQICKCKKMCKSLLEFLWPVSYRIMLWKSIYANSIGNNFLTYFYWKCQGSVDNIRTAQHIIENRNVSVRKRFALACHVCLEREIRELWAEMTNDDKIYLKSENCEKFRPLILFWVHSMEGSDDVSRQYLNDFCKCAFDNGLLEALKYLFAVSSKNTRETMAFKLTRRFHHKTRESEYYLEADELDIGYFLFSEMSFSRRQVMHGFKSMLLTLLLHFSERIHFFNELEECIPSNFPAVDAVLSGTFYNYHLEIIKDEDFRDIFIKVWRKLPASMRDEVARSYDSVRWMSVLIRDNFPFLLRKGAFEKVVKFNSLDATSEIPFDFNRDKWEFLHFLIEEGVATYSTLKSLRLEMMWELKIRKSNIAAWNRLLRFVRTVSKNSEPKQ